MDDEHAQSTMQSSFQVEIPPAGDKGPSESPPPNRSPDEPELLAVLHRIERTLEDVRSQFDTLTRDRRHREFSPARLIGALLQALVLFFVIAALADWVYQAAFAGQLIKLAFAAVFQVGALTAFVLSRSRA